eukprot:g7890.t1
MLAKWGFRGRLGKDEQGVSAPMQVKVRPKNLPLGTGFKEAIAMKANRAFEQDFNAVHGAAEEEAAAAEEEALAAARARGAAGAGTYGSSGAGKGGAAALAARFGIKLAEDESWRGGGDGGGTAQAAARRKPTYRTAAQVLAEAAGGASAGAGDGDDAEAGDARGGARVRIVDMTGRTERVLDAAAIGRGIGTHGGSAQQHTPAPGSGGAGAGAGAGEGTELRGRELLYNLQLLSERAEADLHSLAQRLALEQKAARAMREEASTAARLAGVGAEREGPAGAGTGTDGAGVGGAGASARERRERIVTVLGIIERVEGRMGFGASDADEEGSAGAGAGAGTGAAAPVSSSALASAFELLRSRYGAEWARYELAALVPRLAAVPLQPLLARWQPLRPSLARVLHVQRAASGGAASGDAAAGAGVGDGGRGADGDGAGGRACEAWEEVMSTMWRWRGILLGADADADADAVSVGVGVGVGVGSRGADGGGALAWDRLLHEHFLPRVRHGLAHDVAWLGLGSGGAGACADGAHGGGSVAPLAPLAPLALFAAVAPLLPPAPCGRARRGRATAAAAAERSGSGAALHGLLQSVVVPRLVRATAAWQPPPGFFGGAGASGAGAEAAGAAASQQLPDAWLLPWLSPRLPWEREVADPSPPLLEAVLPVLRRSMERALRAWKPANGEAAGDAAMRLLRPWVQWARRSAAQAEVAEAAAADADADMTVGVAAAAAHRAHARNLRAHAVAGAAFDDLLERAVLPKLAAAVRAMHIDPSAQSTASFAPLHMLLRWGGFGGGGESDGASCDLALLSRHAVLCALEGELLPRWTRVLLDWATDGGALLVRAGGNGGARGAGVDGAEGARRSGCDVGELCTWFGLWRRLLTGASPGKAGVRSATGAQALKGRQRLKRLRLRLLLRRG